MSIIVLKR